MPAASFPRRAVLVAVKAGRIVGTASLEVARLYTVFVAPTCQSTGCGVALLARLQALAVERGETCLVVRSSLTAKGFYQHCGFHAVRDDGLDGIATIWMEKDIGQGAG